MKDASDLCESMLLSDGFCDDDGDDKLFTLFSFSGTSSRRIGSHHDCKHRMARNVSLKRL